VRSDLLILGTGCGLTRSRDDRLISDIMSGYHDYMSVRKGRTEDRSEGAVAYPLGG
jgi:hypothetical protein